MAYDERLAAQVRELVPKGTTEKKMFGGLAFLVGGNMAIAAGGGGLLVRVDPDESDELVRTTRAEPMVMRGRALAGWLRVDAGEDLAEWVERGVGYAGTLPAK